VSRKAGMAQLGRITGERITNVTDIRRQNLSQVVSQTLLARIREGHLSPGDRMGTEATLQEEFNVGRNVIREAVQHLVALGVVDVRPRRGITVSELDSASALDSFTRGALLDQRTVDDLYTFRALIETEIAASAAVAATPEDLRKIEDSFDRFQNAVVRGRDVSTADVEFHHALAEASHNVIYSRVLSALADLLQKYRRQTDVVPGAPEEAVIEHAAILKAVRAGNSLLARDRMAVHIQTAVRRVAEARAAIVDELGALTDEGA